MQQTAGVDQREKGWIDVDFDLRSDTPTGKDPDTHSRTLRQYHRVLWSKPLPDGRSFDLSAETRGEYLHHRSAAAGEFFLASDTVAVEHARKLRHLYDQLPAEENEAFSRRAYTIGGTLIFPSNRISGKQTINQHRGMHPRVLDRLDLTLECIARHYAGSESPLAGTIGRYADFFALFGSFHGYITFFHLQDMVEPDGSVRFFLPFNGFNSSPLPRELLNLETYRKYRQLTLDFVAARNERIRAARPTPNVTT